MATFNLDTTIADLQKHGFLSNRTCNSLTYAGLKTIEDVIRYVRWGGDLKDLPKIGPGSELEIRKLLENCDTSLVAPDNIPKAVHFEELDPLIQEFFVHAFEVDCNFRSSSFAHSSVLTVSSVSSATSMSAVSSESSDSSDSSTSEVSSGTSDSEITSDSAHSAYSSESSDSSDASIWSFSSDSSVGAHPASCIVPEGVPGYLFLKYPDARSFFYTVIKGREQVQKIQPYLNTREQVEYRRWHIQMLDRILKLMEGKHMVHHPQYLQLSALKDDIEHEYEKISLTDILNNFITAQKDAQLQKSFETLCNNLLSVRVLNFLKPIWHDYREAVKYFERPFEEYYRLCPGRYMRKTLTDIYDMVQRFHALEFNSYEQFLDKGEIILNRIREDFPYLEPDECEFVRDFVLRFKVRPLFYLVNRHVRHSKKKECVCFCLLHGLNNQREAHTLDRIAIIQKRTTQQIRRLVSDKTEILLGLGITSEERNFYKNLFAKSATPNLITKESVLFKTIASLEHLPKEDFELFCSLSTLVVGGYEIFNDLGFNCLITPALQWHVQQKVRWELMPKFKKVFSHRYAKQTFFPYSYFGKMPPALYKDVAYLYSLLLEGRPRLNKVVFTAKGVYIGENPTDVASELYRILEHKDEPMTLEELFDQFKQDHPEHSICLPSQLRTFVNKNKEIIRVPGCEGRYALSHWKGV